MISHGLPDKIVGKSEIARDDFSTITNDKIVGRSKLGAFAEEFKLRHQTVYCHDRMENIKKKKKNCCLTLSQKNILDSSKLKEFADDNFKFNKHDRKISYPLGNIVKKGKIARYNQFLLFPQCFQMTCTVDT